jgi:hypothetical protein
MRTWDQNKVAMNQLWPQCQWSDEERRLLTDDLGGLDQDTLYDALRNVKRSRDTLYPQIKWILDAYRELTSARKHASSSRKDFEVHKSVPVDADESRRLASEFVGMIEGASPSDFGMIEGLVLDKVQQLKIDMLPARRVLMYARKRLLGQDAVFGRVSADGDVEPPAFGKAS